MSSKSDENIDPLDAFHSRVTICMLTPWAAPPAAPPLPPLPPFLYPPRPPEHRPGPDHPLPWLTRPSLAGGRRPQTLTFLSAPLRFTKHGNAAETKNTHTREWCSLSVKGPSCEMNVVTVHKNKGLMQSSDLEKCFMPPPHTHPQPTFFSFKSTSIVLLVN